MHRLTDVIVVVLIVFSFQHAVLTASNWSYNEFSENALGPSNWSSMYAKCAGKRQSPIDIKVKEVSPTTFRKFVFQNFESKGVKYDVENDENNVIFTCKQDDLELTGGGFPESPFKLKSFRFHWGSTNTKGSEHSINGSYFPMELQMRFYNSKYSFETSANEFDGQAAFAIFFKISKKPNPALDRILNAVYRLIRFGKPIEMDNIAMVDLLPRDLSNYYVYQGSSSVPPCEETTTWTVFKIPNMISNQQLDKFRNLLPYDEDNNDTLPITVNSRAPQSLNGRAIFENIQAKVGKTRVNNGAQSNNPAAFGSLILFLSCVLIASRMN